MRLQETRSPRPVAAGARVGRKQIQQIDDSEALTLRQAGKLCRLYPVSLTTAMTLARLAYARRPS
jgi:hypothetical protein